MKKTFIVFTVCALLGAVISSCNNSQEKRMQKLAKEAVKENLLEPSSYESVKFGKVDTIYTTFEESEEFLQLKEKHDSLSSLWDKEYCSLDTDYDRLSALIEERKKIIANMDSLENKFIPKPKELLMTHTIRSKNAFGMKITKEVVVKFDTLGTKVTEVCDANTALSDLIKSLE